MTPGIVDLAQDMIALSGFKPEEIPIVFTGIRAGEKLDESLRESGSHVVPTQCASVRRVTEPELCPMDQVPVMFESIMAAALTGDRLDIDAKLARWIPSYVPATVGRWSSVEPS